MADKKPAKPAKPKKFISAKYEADGETVSRKNHSCPKCGPGVFLASHKDRFTCGKCGYMEKRN